MRSADYPIDGGRSGQRALWQGGRHVPRLDPEFGGGEPGEQIPLSPDRLPSWSMSEISGRGGDAAKSLDPRSSSPSSPTA